MIKRSLIPLFVIVFICSFADNVFAKFTDRPRFRLEQLYRCDLKTNKSNLYINRFNATLNYKIERWNQEFKIIPYIENQLNIEHEVWIRNEFGVELGRDITSWMYFGQNFHYADLKEDDRDREDFRRGNRAEWRSRLKFHLPLIKEKDTGEVKLRGYVLNEYTYNLEDGKGYKNEVVIGAVVSIIKDIELNVDWRHIDRVNYYDSDNAEFSCTLLF